MCISCLCVSWDFLRMHGDGEYLSSLPVDDSIPIMMLGWYYGVEERLLSIADVEMSREGWRLMGGCRVKWWGRGGEMCLYQLFFMCWECDHGSLSFVL